MFSSQRPLRALFPELDSLTVVGDAGGVRYPAGDLRVDKGYVAVKDREIPDMDSALQSLAAIDKALTDNGFTRVLFDTRELTAPSDEINELYWKWVQAAANHDRIALVVRSEMKRVEGNMNALSRGAKLRSFHDEDAAKKWLTIGYKG